MHAVCDVSTVVVIISMHQTYFLQCAHPSVLSFFFGGGDQNSNSTTLLHDSHASTSFRVFLLAVTCRSFSFAGSTPPQALTDCSSARLHSPTLLTLCYNQRPATSHALTQAPLPLDGARPRSGCRSRCVSPLARSGRVARADVQTLRSSALPRAPECSRSVLRSARFEQPATGVSVHYRYPAWSGRGLGHRGS